MTLNTRIKQLMKNYKFHNGMEMKYGSILIQITESDYPVNVNSWNESDCKKALDKLIKYWIENNFIIKREQ